MVIFSEKPNNKMLNKWRKLAVAPTSNNKSIRFLKRALSLSTSSVPKGFLALCVGEEMKRFVIPMEYLSRRAFEILLRQAEEEFGFEHEGILRIPCDVSVFESILEMLQKEKEGFYYCTAEAEFAQPYHPQESMCR